MNHAHAQVVAAVVIIHASPARPAVDVLAVLPRDLRDAGNRVTGFRRHYQVLRNLGQSFAAAVTTISTSVSPARGAPTQARCGQFCQSDPIQSFHTSSIAAFCEMSARKIWTESRRVLSEPALARLASIAASAARVCAWMSAPG